MRATARTTCPYCGVGCGVLATLEADGQVAIKGDPDHPANFGRLCSKGSALGETVGLEGRLLFPEVGGRKTGWNEALDLIAQTFARTLAEHGPDSVAFYVSGQILTEDYYVANKLMKGFIGSGNIDTNSRLCMASSVAGHRRAFGSDTVPGSYEDLECADVIVLVGSNLIWCHPVLYQRIAAAKVARPDMRVVLIDPRRTRTADLADLHLALEPDSDAALFNGLLYWIAEHGLVVPEWVSAHTAGFEVALGQADGWNPDAVSRATGLSVQAIEEFYQLWCGNEKVVTAYSQGVNQSQVGTDKVNAILNCHLATARIGRPGMGPFSLTGQPNAMGGREVGGMANTLAAHLDIENAAHRDCLKRFWKSPHMVQEAGLKAVDMFRAVGDGRIKALWIMATNPVVSMPDADDVEDAIRNCPFVVVSDVMANTDTARHAHVKLPSLAWGEKDGTVTNSERRISRQRAFLAPPGEARADWWQMAEVARRMGFEEAFAWQDAGEIFTEYAALTAFENKGARDLDLSACVTLTKAEYDALAPFQWPQTGTGITRETSRFFADGRFFTTDQKARFIPVTPPQKRLQGVASLAPLFRLNTGRVRDHWHTMTRTAKSARLSSHFAEPYCEIHPDDAARLGIAPADLVRLSAGHAKIVVRALLSDAQLPGNVFVPIHWTDQTASSARVDRLVVGRTDPFSGQPASKGASVTVERARFACHGFAVTRARPQTSGLDYWALAVAEEGWRLEFACTDLPSDHAALLAGILGVRDDETTLSAEDRKRGSLRLARFDGARLEGGAWLSTNPVDVSRSWASEQLQAHFETASDRWRILAGRPAGDRPDKGAIVCSCMSIGVNDIATAVLNGCHSVESVGSATRAGTNCGSCQAEIREIILAHHRIAAE